MRAAGTRICQRDQRRRCALCALSAAPLRLSYRTYCKPVRGWLRREVAILTHVLPVVREAIRGDHHLIVGVEDGTAEDAVRARLATFLATE